jgi:hypothetical protein
VSVSWGGVQGPCLPGGVNGSCRGARVQELPARVQAPTAGKSGDGRTGSAQLRAEERMVCFAPAAS